MVVRRMGVWSVAKLYSVMAGTFGLLIGAIIACVSLVGGTLARSDSSTSAFPAAFLGVGAIIIAPIFYAVIGLISGAIGAALYNLFAGIVGGVEMEVEQ